MEATGQCTRLRVEYHDRKRKPYEFELERGRNFAVTRHETFLELGVDASMPGFRRREATIIVPLEGAREVYMIVEVEDPDA